MGRAKWDEIKKSKLFYVRTYRRVSTSLVVSAALNVILAAALYIAYINQPHRDYYATNGVTAPEKLNPMLAPNYSSEALLAPDIDNSAYEQKPIPR